MRICLISDGLPPHCGGASLHTFHHAQRLQDMKGVEVTLIARDRSGLGSVQDSLPDYVIPVKLFRGEVGVTRAVASLAKFLLYLAEVNLRLGWALYKKRRDIDIVHVVNAAPWFNLSAIPLAKVMRKPVVLEMVGLGGDDPLKLNEREGNQERQLFPHRPLRYSLFLKADAYVSISRALSEAYSKAGLSDNKLFQIALGVDAEKFKPATTVEKLTLRQKLGLDADHIVILFVGRLNKDKGVRSLLAAFRQVVPYQSRARLLLVGPNIPPDPAYLQAVQRDISVSGMSDRVVLVDANKMIDNVHEYMQASDIFCLPTRREGFGMVIIEAMACGLAVIVSQLEGVTTDIIQSGREGILFPVENQTELSSAITKLISDGALRARLGAAARQRVLDEFTLDMHYKQRLNLYKRLLADRTAAY